MFGVLYLKGIHEIEDLLLLLHDPYILPSQFVMVKGGRCFLTASNWRLLAIPVSLVDFHSRCTHKCQITLGYYSARQDAVPVADNMDDHSERYASESSITHQTRPAKKSKTFKVLLVMVKLSTQVQATSKPASAALWTAWLTNVRASLASV
jgi:hypothetical protein